MGNECSEDAACIAVCHQGVKLDDAVDISDLWVHLHHVICPDAALCIPVL